MADRVPAEAILGDALRRIQADRAHGASWLAREAALAIAHAAAESETADTASSGRTTNRERWRRLLRELAHARPSMAALAVTVARIYAASRGATPARDGRAALALMRAEAEQLAAAWDTAAGAIANHARPLLARTILTHSRSGTVERVLTRLTTDSAGQIAGFIVTESRPGGEGVAMARALAEAGLAVTMVADAAMGLAAAQAQCVVLGADSLRADGSLVNKIGSYPLALAAHAAGTPVYVLSETLKIAPDGWLLRLEDGDPATLLPAPPPGVTVDATLFDHTPASLLTHIITENGVLRPDELRPYAARAARDLALLDAPSET